MGFWGKQEIYERKTSEHREEPTTNTAQNQVMRCKDQEFSMEIHWFVSSLYQPYLPIIIDLYMSSTFFAAGPGLSASFLLEFSCLQEKTVDLELDFPLDFFQKQSL